MEISYELVAIKPTHFAANSFAFNNQPRQDNNFSLSYHRKIKLISNKDTFKQYEVTIYLLISFTTDNEKEILGALGFEAIALVDNLQLLAKSEEELHGFFVHIADIVFNTMCGYWLAKVGDIPLLNGLRLPLFDKEMLAVSLPKNVPNSVKFTEFENYMTLESYEIAEKILQEIANDKTQTASTLPYFFSLYLRTNQIQKAKEMADKIAVTESNEESINTIYLTYYNHIKQFDEVIRLSSSLIKELVKKPNSKYNLQAYVLTRARAYFALKDYENAKKDVLEILALDPYNEEIRNFLVHINGKLEKSVEK